MPAAKLLLSPVRYLALGLLGLVIIVTGLWCSMALYYSNLPWGWARTVLAIGFGLWTLAAFGAVGRSKRAVIFFCLGIVATIAWWKLIPASYEGEFPPDTAVLAVAEFDGDLVTIRNIRNFEYRSPTDFDVRRYDKTWDLRQLKTVDFILSHWDAQQVIAHTFLSFVFDGPDGEEHLAVSVEIRRRQGQEYSTLQGIFKQYTLIYVWADERDLIRLRTNYRGEDVYLYPTVSDPAGARAMLESMLRRTNELAEQPVFYNTLGQNCTTSIVDHVNEIMPGAIPYSQSILMNGFSDSYAFELGWIKSDKGFLETRADCLINAAARAAGGAPDFSRRIRGHIRR
jgi:hypothetical protein